MQKEILNIDGVDYVVRTLDIRSIPDFDGECYAEVTVAEESLSEYLDLMMMGGSKQAVRLDETIFFYLDNDLMRSDLSDEILVKCLESELHKKPIRTITNPIECDFYAIEEDCNGEKQIHILGYTELSDKWECTDVCWFIEPLKEFIEHVKEDEDYVDSTMSEFKQYIYDMNGKEIMDTINAYFNFDGKPADAYLRYDKITMQTPLGNYINAKEVVCDANGVAIFKGDHVLWHDAEKELYSEYEVYGKPRDEMVRLWSENGECEALPGECVVI